MIDFLNKDKIITGNYYSTLLTTLREKTMERKPERYPKNICFCWIMPLHIKRIIPCKQFVIYGSNYLFSIENSLNGSIKR